MGKKSWLAAALCAVVFAAVSAVSAFAGEVTGNGKDTQGPAHANSICVFSGQNHAPQGWIQRTVHLVERSVRAGRSNGSIDPRQFNPGDACRGGSN